LTIFPEYGFNVHGLVAELQGCQEGTAAASLEVSRPPIFLDFNTTLGSVAKVQQRGDRLGSHGMRVILMITDPLARKHAMTEKK
jgi:hypothetical protein